MKTLGDNPLFDQFIAAGQELALPLNTDFNGATQDGVGRYHANVYQGQRWGSSKTFLRPIKKAPNFTIKTGIQVEKITFLGKQATGVIARHKNQRRQARDDGRAGPGRPASAVGNI